MNVEDEMSPDHRSYDQTELLRMDVTLIDAFKIKEINLLIASYVFAMCHNLQLLQSNLYSGIHLDETWLACGSIIGVLLTGALVDLVFRKRLFLTILALNCCILSFDVYLFCQDFSNR